MNALMLKIAEKIRGKISRPQSGGSPKKSYSEVLLNRAKKDFYEPSLWNYSGEKKNVDSAISDMRKKDKKRNVKRGATAAAGYHSAAMNRLGESHARADISDQDKKRALDLYSGRVKKHRLEMNKGLLSEVKRPKMTTKDALAEIEKKKKDDYLPYTPPGQGKASQSERARGEAVINSEKKITAPHKPITSPQKAVTEPHKAITQQNKAITAPHKAITGPHQSVEPVKAEPHNPPPTTATSPAHQESAKTGVIGKKKMSTGAKVAIGVGVTAAGLYGAKKLRDHLRKKKEEQQEKSDKDKG